MRVSLSSLLTRHLHFWQKDRDLLRATTQCGRGNTGMEQKLTPEKKILPLLLQGRDSNPRPITGGHESGALTGH